MAEEVITLSTPVPNDDGATLTQRLPTTGRSRRPISFFAARRLRMGVVTFVAAVLLCLLFRRRYLSLAPDTVASGWVLLILVVFLAAYNLRKKLPFIPLGRSSTWLQLHIYAGLLSVIIFVAHSHGRMPRGMFEAFLALLYSSTAISGLVGLALTRLLPPRLTARGEQVLFERIPAFRRKLRELGELTARNSVTEADATTLADFYAGRAAPFFAAPRNFVRHLLQSSQPRQTLLAELEDLDRYLNPREREFATELRDLIHAKDDLDHQYALQATLKGWLFVHLPLTYSLLLVASVHLFLVRAFGGGGA